MVATLNHYKVVSKDLQDRLAKEKLTSLAAISKYKRVEQEVHQLRVEKELLSTPTKELVLKSNIAGVSSSRTKDSLL